MWSERNGHSHFLKKLIFMAIVDSILTKKMSISPKVLADRLKELEQLGIISKKINPLQTNYKLTKKGISLHEILHNLKIWQGAYNNLQCATTLCSECTEIKSMHNKSIDT